MAQAWVYVLRRERNGRYYIGHTTNLVQRLETHNAGSVKATRYLRPWELVYSEKHPDGTSARRREAYLKRLKSRRALEGLRGFAG